MSEDHISLAHGNGGRFMRELIDGLFARHLRNPSLDVRVDAATLQLDAGPRFRVHPAPGLEGRRCCMP